MSEPATANTPVGAKPASSHRRVPVWLILVVVVTVGAMIPVSQLLEGPPFVDELRVENPTKYDITVEVADSHRTGWLGVGTAHGESTSTFKAIVDQGAVWNFRFLAQGEEGGELVLARQELERNQWQIRIPHSVGEQLQAKGAPFPP